MTNAMRIYVKWKLKIAQHIWEKDFINAFDESGGKKSLI